MYKWTNVQCNLFDEIEEKYFVEGLDSEGDMVVIAKIDLANKTVEYVDDAGMYDEDVQQVIKEMFENGYILTE